MKSLVLRLKVPKFALTVNKNVMQMVSLVMDVIPAVPPKSSMPFYWYY
jgi:hypothetical protein